MSTLLSFGCPVHWPASCRQSLMSAWRMQLDPLQQARMHLAIAASASAVYQTLLRLRGPSPEEQAHVKELVCPFEVLVLEQLSRLPLCPNLCNREPSSHCRTVWRPTRRR